MSGEIITFYSYKGGTGRTMALANVAALLAERASGQKVLAVDWDLEAPGLHRFFPPLLAPPKGSTDLGLDATPGLIDLFIKLEEVLPKDLAKSAQEAETRVEAAFDAVELEQFVSATAIPGVVIIRAGRDDDGDYARRVNTFNWEDLFKRGPSIYRVFAERLGKLFPFVLIDSRTGVTDISGICTAFLPEKLVVVFTPNLQSLTGIRKLVQRATSYRRESDDLRPLLVYPLPSRIEASLERMRDLWRRGDRDLDIVGYQPMFQSLLGETYGVECDLTAYFDAVQIQQTPDYAYGEQIAVLKTNDRFSLGNSYRVFVDWLLRTKPPWEKSEAAVPASSVPEASSAPSEISFDAPTSASAAPPPSETTVTVGPTRSPKDFESVPPPASSTRDRRAKVFMSYARADRERVSPIATALERQGFEVFRPDALSPGVAFPETIARTLDASDVVVVCWSKDSVASQWVAKEAEEGLRRGILVPVLLDDESPPLGFRSVNAVDLRRDSHKGLRNLVAAVSSAADRTPGTPTMAAPSSGGSGLSRLAVGLVAIVAVSATLVAILSVRTRSLAPVAVPLATEAPAPTPVTPLATVAAAAPERVAVPNFVGSQSTDVVKAAELLGIRLTFKDRSGKTQTGSVLEGTIVAQDPPAERMVSKGTTVELTVGNSVIVPTVVGLTLENAATLLDHAQLRSVPTFRVVKDAKPGTIIAQDPTPGTNVAGGYEVKLVVAKSPSSRR